MFQELLQALARIASRHETDIASIATRLVLDSPGVAAAIVGATNTSHLQAHSRIGALRLDGGDLAAIAAVTDGAAARTVMSTCSSATAPVRTGGS